MEWEKIYTERRNACQGLIRRLLDACCLVLLFSGGFSGNPLYGQQQTEKQTRTYNVYGKQSRENPGVICPYDTIYLSVILEDSSMTEVYYRWELSRDGGLNWTKLPNAEMSYLIYPNPQEGVQFRCKSSNDLQCIEDAQCEGEISLFKPVISPLPKYRYEVFPASCGKNNGKITLVPFHSSEAPFRVIWNQQITTTDLTAARPGKHFLQVISDKGCVVNESITIPESGSKAPEILIELNNATCGLQNGSVRVSPVSPSAVYEYEWSSGETSAFLDSLHIGKYGLKIKDVSGCEKDTLITISNVTSPFFVRETHKDASCGLPNGSVAVHATGTGKPFRFEWSTGDTTPAVKSLSPGFYNVSVYDKSGCREELNGIQIKDKPAFQLGFETVSPTCYGGYNGKARIILPGNPANYAVLWNNESTSVSLDGLASGEYHVKVKEISTECVVSGIVMLDEPPPVLVETSTTIDKGAAEIEVFVGNGRPPFLFQLNEKLQDSSLFVNITEEVALITVTDNDGCTARDTVLVVLPSPAEPASLPSIHYKNDIVETIYFAPNTITPNNDKQNDAFFIDSPDLNDAMIEIYDKTGRKIFSDYMSQSVFVGSAESVICLEGLYYYTARLEYNNGEIRNIKGSFKLIRE